MAQRQPCSPPVSRRARRARSCGASQGLTFFPAIAQPVSITIASSSAKVTRRRMFSLPLGDGLSLGGMAAVVGELVRLPRTASPTVNIWRPFADREDGISSTFSLLVIGASSDRRTDRVGIAGMDERKFFGGIISPSSILRSAKLLMGIPTRMTPGNFCAVCRICIGFSSALFFNFNSGSTRCNKSWHISTVFGSRSHR